MAVGDRILELLQSRDMTQKQLGRRPVSAPDHPKWVCTELQGAGLRHLDTARRLFRGELRFFAGAYRRREKCGRTGGFIPGRTRFFKYLPHFAPGAEGTFVQPGGADAPPMPEIDLTNRVIWF